MIIGTVKERKNNEARVGLTPSGVSGLVASGNVVYVEQGAGVNAGFTDEEYVSAGAKLVETEKEVFDACELIVKVKELATEEFDFLKEGQIIFAYLHLAANTDFAKVIAEKKATAIAYETVMDSDGNCPCLRPMSQIAGRLAIQEGTKFLQSNFGGRGIMLGGVPGVERGHVVILGCGTAGLYSAKAAVGIGADVTILGRDLNKLEKLDNMFGSAVTALYMNEQNLCTSLKNADLVIGTVRVPGGKTPVLIKREHLKLMKKGAVIIDVAIDQGGCCETSHLTSHANPTFIEEGIVHYGVPNMPGAVPYTSTVALTAQTVRYAQVIAKKGLEKALVDDPGFVLGLNFYKGKCVNQNVADALGLECEQIVF